MIKNIIVFILILILIAVVVFLDVPKLQQILNLRQQAEEQKEIFLEKQNLLVKIEELSKSYQEGKKNLEKINHILPSGQDIPNLIVQLEALAFEGGLVLENIRFSLPEEKKAGRAQEVRTKKEVALEDYNSLTVDLSLIGDYSAFKNFLKAVEDNIRLMDITSISLSPEAREESQLFNFNLQVKTYYQ